ncbi:pseudouridine synthase [Conexibacter sp. S30A1]|jgi:23S rRNA pseudouridine2605 synthase|uniref:pseudouridine synthase n=1 Tax=Conexibacter sp. S30A1 TaxID=2937800 RepID=UPI00200E1181|nr:pseudouridine synthase [Conexibacter sp. S30A1]
MRLAKYLAGCGVASRRASEELVRSGAVTVDGECVTDPARDVADGMLIEVHGRAVTPVAATVVYAVNKPAGVVSTARDPQGRPTVVALVKDRRRLYPVGRLDADTTGLILLTDDGALAHRLTHPRFGVEKTYRVRVQNGPVGGRALALLRDGVQLEDGRTAPARVRRVSPGTLELTIHEGRKRQVKRMCEAVGHPVLALERVRLGPLVLGDLALGGYRQLTSAEVSLLRAAGSTPRTAVSPPGAAPAGSGPGRRAVDGRRRAAGS